MNSTAGAAEIARLFQTGDVTAEATVSSHIATIRQENTRLNAVVADRFETALDEARDADRSRAIGGPTRPLEGVPITIKDSIDLAGFASTFGLRSRANASAEVDEQHVARLRAAGAIVLGKTNVAQMLLAHETDNPLFGRANHPLDGGRTPGGSSGGEAAIIASGGSALGLGSDIAGSVRIPAAFCGIAALKPTTGRLPDRGRFSAHPGQQAVPSQIGVMARGVEDVALGLEIANGGTNPGRLPLAPLMDWRAVDVSSLRVGWYDDDTLIPPSASVRRALHGAVGKLKTLGAHVERWDPPHPRHAASLFAGILAADGAASLARILGRDPLVPGLRAFYTLMRLPRSALRALEGVGPLFGRDTLAEMMLPTMGHRDTLHYWDLVDGRDTYAEDAARSLDHATIGPIDVVLSPAYPLVAPPHGTTGNLGFGGLYSVLWNLLGYPAGVVPFGHVSSDDDAQRTAGPDRMLEAARRAEAGTAGLPLSVQVAARPWREDHVLAAMSALEKFNI